MMRMIFKTNLYSKGVVVAAVVVALSQTHIKLFTKVVRTDWWGIIRNCVVGRKLDGIEKRQLSMNHRHLK